MTRLLHREMDEKHFVPKNYSSTPKIRIYLFHYSPFNYTLISAGNKVFSIKRPKFNDKII